MTASHFVGRHDDIRRLGDILTGSHRGDGKLTVQSIEGPGGVGKSWLFDHVLSITDVSNCNYLTLRVDANDRAAESLPRLVDRFVHGAEAAAIRGKPPGYYFARAIRATKGIAAIRAEA